MFYLRPIHILKGLIDAVAASLALFSFFVCSSFTWLLFYWTPNLRLKLLCRVVAFHSRIALWAVSIRVKISEKDKKRLRKPALLIGNHLSYLDVLVLASHAPTCFVTSVETKETPFLGWICQLAGCVFVERRNKINIHKEVKEITEALRRGHNVAIYPEATSTNGESILRFRSPLFTAAIDAGADIQTMILNLRKIDGRPVTVKNRDGYCWYGDMTFAPHFLGVAALKSVDIELTTGLRLHGPYEQTPKELAHLCQVEIEKHYIPIR